MGILELSHECQATLIGQFFSDRTYGAVEGVQLSAAGGVRRVLERERERYPTSYSASYEISIYIMWRACRTISVADESHQAAGRKVKCLAG